MAEKRKPISKKIRFEVLKRDSFRCQYCGRSIDNPDVILEVDHIIPVAEGGDNSIMNLITSCRKCNRGKGARKLSDETALVKQKKMLDEIQARKETIEMMAQWKAELMQETERMVIAVEDYVQAISGYTLTDYGKQKIRRLISQFGYSDVYECTQIAFDKYYFGDDNSWDKAFGKIGGICYNRKNGRGADYYGNKKSS